MSQANVERARAVMPPDGTDLVEVFVGGSGFSAGVTKRDGVEMEHEAAGVFRFEGDRVVEIEFNLDRDDALAG